MSHTLYTLGSWHVRAGQEQEFIRVWRDELAPAFLAANPATRGTLIQSIEDPQQFYSFGPWDSLEQIETARSDPRAGEAIAKLIALCDEGTPGTFRVVLTIP